MPNPRKLFLANTVVMVTFRTEEGLPFVPVRFINAIIKSALARAYELYGVEVAGVTFEPNHVHFVIRVTDPEAVPKFIGYIKQETSHALNRLLGRRKKTIWDEGYDSPTILDSAKALKQIAYVLLNPVKDHLVSDMDEYPGFSSYSMMKNDKLEFKTDRVFRDSIYKLRDPRKPWLEENTYQFDDERKNEVVFKLFPYSWKNCFPDTKDLSNKEIREKILDVLEAELETIEKKDLSPERLKRQSLLAEYKSKKFGKRMICLASCITYRRKFINLYRYLCTLACQTLTKWTEGHLLPFPAGLFPPCQPRTSNLITREVWT